MAQLMQPQLPSVVPEKQVAFAEIECQPSQTPPETLEMFKPDAVLRRGDDLIGILNSVSDSLPCAIMDLLEVLSPRMIEEQADVLVKDFAGKEKLSRRIRKRSATEIDV